MDKLALGKVDKELIKELADILKETDLTEIEYEVGGAKIKIARNVVQSVVASNFQTSAPAAISAPAVSGNGSDLKSHPGVLKSPMVGTVYLAPEPGASAFVRVGDTVSVGQNLLIIEAMKVMNPIKASTSGTVKQSLVRDGEPVEFDTPLLIIE